jgi:hypothetical protein
MPAIFDLVGVLSSKRLRWRTPLGDMPGDYWIRSYSVVRTINFSYNFQRKCGEVLLPVAIMAHILRSMVKSKMENDMEFEFLMASNDDSSLCDIELAW